MDVEGPPPQPGLSHGGLALDAEYVVAATQPSDVTSTEPLRGPSSYSYSARFAAEWALAERRAFLGAAADLVAGGVPFGATPDARGSTAVAGNPELWARALWTSRVGFSAGGGLGLVLPLPRSYDATETEVVRAGRVVRPWADPHFEDRALTARPFLDIRHVVGPVTFQLRQGLDVLVRARSLAVGEGRVDLAALASVFAGVRVAPPVTLGLEVHEVYQLTEDVSAPGCLAPCDRLRVQFTVAPSVRLAWRDISPTLSLLFPLSTPLRADVASYQAARFHVGARIPLP